MALTSIRRVAPLAATIVTAALVVACSGAASGPAGPAAEEPQSLSGADRTSEDGAAAGGGESGDGGPDAVLALDFERRIIKVGEISLEVADVETALGEVRALAQSLNGYVGASQASDSDSGATLTLRVPADRFESALDELRAMDGDVPSETTQEDDVTSSIVDLEARIENLRASEITYRALLERASEIEDVLAVQSRLDEVRGQIEQLDAQAQALAGEADLSTLTVHLQPRAVPVAATTESWNPGQTVEQAVAALLILGQAILTAIIWIGVVFVPLGIVFGVATLVVIRVVQPLRRRVAEPRP